MRHTALIDTCLHSTNKNIVKWLWYYSLLEDKLEGYDLTEVEKHGDLKFTLSRRGEFRCIRGKVIFFQNQYYLLVWTPGYQAYPTSVVEKVLERIEEKFDISYIINEAGDDIFNKN